MEIGAPEGMPVAPQDGAAVTPGAQKESMSPRADIATASVQGAAPARSDRAAAHTSGTHTSGSARGRVLRSLLMAGPATAPQMAARIGLTAAGVRRHLDAMAQEGLIESGARPAYGRAPDRGRGRPAKVFSITEAGRDSFEHSYDEMALAALRFMADQWGADAVGAFATEQAAQYERRYLPLVDQDKPLAERAGDLAAALTRDGYAATAEDDNGSALQICQHNCPVAHVAEQFPQMCEAERRAMERLLGSHVMRIATIAHGDPVCTAVVSGIASPDPDPDRPPIRDLPSQGGTVR